MNQTSNPFATPDHGIDRHAHANHGESENFRYVGFWKRVLAYIVDNILLSIAFIPLMFVFPAFIDNPRAAELTRVILTTIFGFVITILFWQFKQSTPGKMIFNAKIVDEVTLKKPTLGKLILRNICYFPSALILCLGFIWIAFDKKKRGWHDLMAGTMVITPDELSSRRVVRRPVKSDSPE